ncbi:hypothetical protein BKA69DRAFT_1099948 [Paraphysoderma sedebokerense]|nr:hypothetical protein BKA69DRAFT_1099948 [Paraphysoderma sedebokerense]
MQGAIPVVHGNIANPISLFDLINPSSNGVVQNLPFPPMDEVTADVNSIYLHLPAISLAPDKDFYEINEMDPKDPRAFVKETKSKVTNETSKEIEIKIKFDNVDPLLKYNRHIRFRITSELMKEGNVLPDATANHHCKPEKVLDVNSMLSPITIALEVDALEKPPKPKCNVLLQITSLVDGRDAWVNTFITPHFCCYSHRTKRRLENTNSTPSGACSSNSVNDVEGTAASDLSFNQNLHEETVSNSESSSCSGKRSADTEIDTQRANKRSAMETEFILDPSQALSFIRQLEPESIPMRFLFRLFWEKHCMKPSEWSIEQLKDTLCEFVNFGGIRRKVFLNL